MKGLFGLKGVLREYRIVEEVGLVLRTRSDIFGLNLNVVLKLNVALKLTVALKKNVKLKMNVKPVTVLGQFSCK